MSAKARDAIAEAMHHAVSESLGQLAIPFRVSDAAQPDLAGKDCYCTSIGFAGHVRGTMILLSTEPVIRAMTPPDVREHITSEAAVRDVVGELANQTLGRLKNALLPRGIVIMLAVPTTVSGRSLELGSPGESFSEWFGHSSDVGELHVRLDADLSACPEPREAEAPAETPMSEGELLFF